MDNGFAVLVLGVGLFMMAIAVGIAIRRGYTTRNILDETLLGWPVVLMALAHLAPTLRIPAVLLMSLILLRIVWNFARRRRR